MAPLPRILIVAHYYPPHVGGIEAVAEHQAQSLAKEGHQTTVVTSALGDVAGTQVDARGVRVVRVRAWSPLERFGVPYPLFSPALLMRLVAQVRRADVVHIHDVFYLSSLCAYLIARLYRRPVVVTQHVALVAHGSRVVVALERAVYALWGRRILRGAERVVTYQRGVRSFVLAQRVDPTRVVSTHNGIDLATFAPIDEAERRARRHALGLPEDRALVLYVGRFVDKKGYQILFDARDPAYDLVFVGAEDVPAAFHNAPHVHVLGQRTPEEIAYLMPAMDMFAAPSVGETWMLSLQEAMASGLAILTTNEPGYEEYALDTELFVRTERTASSVRATLVAIAADVERMRAMGAYARAVVEKHFNRDEYIDAMRELYQSLSFGPAAASVVVTTSWDDGHVLDLRLADMLVQHGIKGTFYVAPRDRELCEQDRLTDEQVRVLDEQFEIGAHTMSHRHLTALKPEDAWREVVESKAHLERVVGHSVTSFCYPAGKHKKRHAQMARDAGFALARTVRRFVCRAPKDPFEMHTSVHTYDHWLDIWGVLVLARFNLKRFFPLYRHWDRQAIALFDRVHEQGGVFHLWGHSWEVDEHDDWQRLERVLAHIGGHRDVVYAENKDVV